MALPSNTPDLISIELFVALAEKGSIGKVARARGLSQQAVSARLALLERQLGVHLLERSPRGTRLGAAGEALLCPCRDVVAAMEALMRARRQLTAGTSAAQLRVAASATIGDHLLLGWLEALAERCPAVVPELRIASSEVILGLIEEGEVELGFVEGEPSLPAETCHRSLGGDRLAIVVAPDHPFAGRGTLRVVDLAATPLIVRESGSSEHRPLEAALAGAGVSPAPFLEVSSVPAMLAAARRGHGAAVASILDVEADLAHGRLVEVPVENLQLPRAFAVVWARGRRLSPVANALLEASLDTAASENGEGCLM